MMPVLVYSGAVKWEQTMHGQDRKACDPRMFGKDSVSAWPWNRATAGPIDALFGLTAHDEFWLAFIATWALAYNSGILPAFVALITGRLVACFTDEVLRNRFARYMYIHRLFATSTITRQINKALFALEARLAHSVIAAFTDLVIVLLYADRGLRWQRLAFTLLNWVGIPAAFTD